MKSFKKWVIEKYDGADDPKGDFAEDLKRDKNFPMWVRDGYVIKWYLKYTCKACEEAIETFEELWQSYCFYRQNEKRAAGNR